jgi:paired small multidrug resistance pump
MGWMYLILAGCCEVIGVIAINKVTQQRNWKSIALLICGFVLSFSFLSQAMQTIAMGTAYAVWTGIGTVGGAFVGMLMYGEPKEWRRMLFIGMVLSAAIGLKLIS